MGAPLHAYATVHFIAAIVSLVAAWFAWKRRSARGAVWIVMMMVAAAWWSFTDGMDLSATDLETHIFWAKLSYLGGGTVAVFLLAFSLEYTRHDRRLEGRRVAALLVPPLAVFVATLFNEYHHLTWRGFITQEADPRVVVYVHGPVFWLLVAYSFCLLAISAIVIVTFALKAEKPYKTQSLVIMAAILVPWAAMIAYVIGPGRLPGLFPSITLVASGTLLTFSIVRHKLLDLVPIAREALVEKMSDGLIALDVSGRVVDLNPATRRLLGLQATNLIGTHVDSLLSDWPDAALRLRTPGHESDAFTLQSGSAHLGFEVSPLRDPAGACQGKLVIVRDVTDRVVAEQALTRANDELKAQVTDIERLHAELSDQAIRDPLTRLYNRRYLEEMVGHEIGRATREGYPVSVIMLDIDGFKRINDIHGHATGDLILRYLGSHLRSQSRAGDIACRYGGDEFLLVLTNTDPTTAAARAEEWRASFEESSKSMMGLTEPVTVSFGVATYPLHGETIEQVFAAADGAMYAAKASGRNRVVVTPS